MGICSSCLGGRRPSDSEPSDSSHLLGDSYPPHYGALHGPASHSAPQPDPEDIRRQRDALERICAQTSDKLIDVSQATHSDEGSKMVAEYPRLFNERFPALKPQASRPPSADARLHHDDADDDDADAEAAWLASAVGSSAEPEGSWDRVEPVESGTLTIQFGDPLGQDKRQVR